MEHDHPAVARSRNRAVALAVAPYLAILAFCSFLLYHAFRIPPGSDGKLGADVWPKTILVLAILTCAWKIATTGLRARDARPSSQHDASEDRSASRDEIEDPGDEIPAWLPWLGIALTVGYVFLFSEIGYFLATVLFVATFIYAGNYRRPFVAASVALTAAFAFVFIFMKIVYVSLPMGDGPFRHLSEAIMMLMGIK